MLIFDGHLDLALNAVQNGRDLLLDAHTTRTLEVGMTGMGKAQGTVALPDMRRGRVALCFTTVCARCSGRSGSNTDFATPAQAYAAARGQLGYYRALEQQGYVRVIMGREDLDAHLGEWHRWENETDRDSVATPPLGLIVIMESADPVLRPEQVEEWWEAGLRVIGPAHFGPGRYAGGTGCNLGLTDVGPALLKEMERCEVLLDLSHLSDEAFWQCFDHYGGPLLATHANCRELVPQQRAFDDTQLRAILERDGVIGVTLGNWQLTFGWMVGGKNDGMQVKLARAVDHIDHICQLAGDGKHVAIGSDLDGGCGKDEFPDEVDTIADLQLIESRLAARGYDNAAIADILHNNWVELLRRCWGK